MRIPRAATSALVLVALVWGYNWVVMKRALQYVAPFPFLAVRLLIAAACLFALLAALRRPMRIGHWPQVTAIGLVHTAATFALMLFALKFGAAGKTAVLSYAMPFFVTVFAWPILGERPRKAHWLAIFVALAGLVLLFNPSARPGLSELLALASGVTWAAGVVITKRLQVRHHVDTLALSAWQMFVAGVAMLALMWAFPGRPWIWTPYVVFALAFNALVVSALSWVLWFWILGQLEAGVASLGTMVVPGVGLLAGAMELHERLGTIEWSGIMLIFAALAVTGIASLREGRPVLDAKGPI